MATVIIATIASITLVTAIDLIMAAIMAIRLTIVTIASKLTREAIMDMVINNRIVVIAEIVGLGILALIIQMIH